MKVGNEKQSNGGEMDLSTATEVLSPGGAQV